MENITTNNNKRLVEYNFWPSKLISEEVVFGCGCIKIFFFFFFFLIYFFFFF